MTCATERSPARFTTVLVVTAVLGAACGSGGASDVVDPQPMIVDYSPTLSDVPALLFLAARTDVDLLAVTLPGTGESDCGPGVRHTRALLTLSGHAATPVGCGRDEPLAGDRDWPVEWREAANVLAGVALPHVSDLDAVDAVELLSDSLRSSEEPVTIVTLGPLTNVGLVLESEPALVDQIAAIVTMGGAFDVGGNVEAAPAAEWNVHIDPEAVRVVVESGVPITFVGLDATNSVPGDARLYGRLAAADPTDAGVAVSQLWRANLDTVTSEGWYFWDELAAVVAVDRSVATIASRSISVDPAGATVADPTGVAVDVASDADAVAFEKVFLETLLGGPVPEPEVTAGERAYVRAVEATLAAFDKRLGDVFGELESQIGVASADDVLGRWADALFAGIGEVHDGLRSADPPPEYELGHRGLVELLAEIGEAEPVFKAAIVAGAPSEPMTDELFWGGFERAAQEAGIEDRFDGFDAACAELELVALARGATGAGFCPSG